MDYEKKWELIRELRYQVEVFDSLARNRIALDEFYKRAKMYFRKMFGKDSFELGELEIAYDSVIATIDFDGDFYHQNLEKFKAFFDNIQNKMVNDATNSMNNTRISRPSTPVSNKVFIVHGHDEGMKEAVARTLQNLDLEPIILHEKPNKGRTIIEKFFDYADVSFAVVLLSPDDLAYSKDASPKKAMFRARQNVILELGYFLGRLDREHVVALHARTENFEIPSDFAGVLFIPFDNLGQWKLGLVKELQACGFDVDANKLTR